nr:MAG TPA: hypothetical protein [Caudoviricetes sp.]
MGKSRYRGLLQCLSAVRVSTTPATAEPPR